MQRIQVSERFERIGGILNNEPIEKVNGFSVSNVGPFDSLPDEVVSSSELDPTRKPTTSTGSSQLQ